MTDQSRPRRDASVPGTTFTACTHPMTLTLRSQMYPGALIRARAHYDSRQPFSVRVCFHHDTEVPVEWVFGRDLLLTGLTRPAGDGDGDVRVRPSLGDAETVLLELRSPFGVAVLAAPRDAVVGFVSCAAEIVPFGQEDRWLDTDVHLGRLLADGR